MSKRQAQAKSRCHGLYYASMRADQAYTKAVMRAFDETRDARWKYPHAKQMAVPAVRAAYNRKVAIDKARARACDVMRVRG
jgi:hypothetical protein